MTFKWTAQQQPSPTSTIPQAITQSLSQMGYLPLRVLGQSLPSNILVLCTRRTMRRVVVKCINWKPGSPCAELRAMMRLQQATTTTNSSVSNKAVGQSRRHSTKHPHMIELLEAFEDGGRVYLVYPWLAGGDLLYTIAGRTSCAHGPGRLSVQETRTYFLNVVEGLLHLKHHGIAHGDVSPENMVLTGTDVVPTRVLLIDLGSSKIVAAADGVVHDYRYGGKVGYVPPEIVDGCPQPQQQQHAVRNGSSFSSPILSCSTTSPLAAPSSPSSEAAWMPPSASSSSSCSSPTAASASLPSSSTTAATSPASHQPRAPPASPAAAVKPLSPYGPTFVVDAYAVDVWALGACLFGMLTGRQMYLTPGDLAFKWLATGRVDDLLKSFVRHHGIALPSDAHDLICQMMRPDPAARLILEQVILHPWVARSDAEKIEEQVVQGSCVVGLDI